MNIICKSFCKDAAKSSKLALNACREIFSKSEIFDGGCLVKSGIEKLLVQFAMNKVFGDFGQMGNSSYKCTPLQLGPYNNKVLTIHSPENHILTIARTDGGSTLPRAAKYKKNLAQRNQGFGQIEMDIINAGNFFEQGMYGIIGYGVKDMQFSHLGIIFPDKDFKNIIHRQNLLDELFDEETFKPMMSEEEYIVGLKDDLVKVGKQLSGNQK